MFTGTFDLYGTNPPEKCIKIKIRAYVRYQIEMHCNLQLETSEKIAAGNVKRDPVSMSEAVASPVSLSPFSYRPITAAAPAILSTYHGGRLSPVDHFRT